MLRLVFDPWLFEQEKLILEINEVLTLTWTIHILVRVDAVAFG